jgi:hypothetical protein
MLRGLCRMARYGIFDSSRRVPIVSPGVMILTQFGENHPNG